MKQHEKIIARIYQNKNCLWWYAKDFMPPSIGFDHPHFVGYEASARMSDVVSEYPELFEVSKDGKYRTIRLRFEKISLYPDVENMLGLRAVDKFII